MNVGIIGHGFVGNAVSSSFTDEVNCYIVDPKAPSNLTIHDALPNHMQFIFLCLPTPSSKNGMCDVRLIESTLNVIAESYNYCNDTVIVIKSTILPSQLSQLIKTHTSLNIVYNPEFLTQANAKEDFLNPVINIYGGDEAFTKQLSEFYLTFTKCKPCKEFYTDAETASLVKYSINSFLATKVIFMNHLHEIHQKSNAKSSFEEFTNILSADARVGESHLSVPGPDGNKGFGGSCFPKDTQAFVDYTGTLDANFDLLELVILLNSKFRV